MNFQSYLEYFNRIIKDPQPAEPYNNPEYLEYTKLNWTRMNRWLKHGEVDETLKNIVKKIDKPQSWIVITEPWCGDAAHLVPFFHLITEVNPLQKADYELRDSPPNRIDQYLTNGSKSIPILVVKDEKGTDLFRWGPRPKEAQELYLSLHQRNAGFEETKIALQQWYNKDKGHILQAELKELLQ